MSSLRAPLCAVAVGSLGVVNVRALCVSDRHVIEVALRDDRSRAAERPLTWRAGPVRGSPARATPMAEDACPGLPGHLSCALVSCVAYV